MSTALPSAAASLIAAMLLLGTVPVVAEGDAATEQASADATASLVEAGRRMYRDGVLPSGELMVGLVQDDVALTGEQVICGRCHRRSGMGSLEGQEVAPAVVADILFNPLRLPTSQPPLPPERRPAYTDESLKAAIRAGIGANGQLLGPLMPRYRLADSDMEALLAYLKTLSTDPAPGVTDTEIHLATIVGDSVDPATRKAFLDVLETYFDQKNRESRHETDRSEHAPWHKAWIMGSYRKWVLHVWELEGPPETWPGQLRTRYEQEPVFAVVSGIVGPASWQPVHAFCEQTGVPCLFPITDVPVIDERDFYTIYFTRGMALEADAVADHILAEGPAGAPVVQVYRTGDPRSEAAAEALRRRITERGGNLDDVALDAEAAGSSEPLGSALSRAEGGTLVLWLDADDLGKALAAPASPGPGRIYLSSTLYGTAPGRISPETLPSVYLVHPRAMPDQQRVLLARSNGWLKARRIFAPEAADVQANAFFALKIAGEALKGMRQYYLREYMLERIEHMMENATYTSVYPRLTLAPGQRFVSKGAHIAQFSADEKGGLTAVTEWTNPAPSGSR